MMETIRQLVERYPCQPPLSVQTELSAARVPSYALSQRSQKLLWQDVRGVVSRQGEFMVQSREMATGEGDRRQTRAFLEQLGRWLEQQGCNGGIVDERGSVVTAVQAGLPSLQEAYDDGTAAWSMGLVVQWLTKDK